jgi:hypothetical protein
MNCRSRRHSGAYSPSPRPARRGTAKSSLGPEVLWRRAAVRTRSVGPPRRSARHPQSSSVYRTRRVVVRMFTVYGITAAVPVLALGGLGCGASSAPVTAVPGGASIHTPESAPAFCKTLTSAKPLLALGAAMNQLAHDPHERRARATVRDAAIALKTAAGQAPRPQRIALLHAASALRALGNHGLVAAGGLNRALNKAGRILQHSCSFPLD